MATDAMMSRSEPLGCELGCCTLSLISGRMECVQQCVGHTVNILREWDHLEKKEEEKKSLRFMREQVFIFRMVGCCFGGVGWGGGGYCVG